MNPTGASLRRILSLALGCALLVSCADSAKKKKHADDDDVRVKRDDASASPASSSSAKKDDDSSTITFTFVPESVNARFEYSSADDFKGDLKVGDKTTPVTSSDKRRYTVEILEVKDGVASKARVRYVEYESKDSMADKKDGEPVVGRLYVLERSGTTLEVDDENGKPVSPGEAAYMQKKWRKFGRKRKFGPAIDKLTARVGEDVPKLAAAFASDDSDPDDGDEVKSAKMTLKSRDGGTARFEYAVEMTSGKLGAAVRISGTLDVDIATGLRLKDDGAADMDMTNEAKHMSLKAHGTGVDLAKRL